MKTLKETKEIYAKSKGYESWEDIETIASYKDSSWSYMQKIMNEVAELYAKEVAAS